MFFVVQRSNLKINCLCRHIFIQKTFLVSGLLSGPELLSKIMYYLKKKNASFFFKKKEKENPTNSLEDDTSVKKLQKQKNIFF